MKKLLTLLIILCSIFVWNFYIGSARAVQTEDLYYYNCGRRVALSLSSEAIAVKFRGSAKAKERLQLIRSVGRAVDKPSKKGKAKPKLLERVKLGKGVTSEECLSEIQRLNTQPQVEYATPLLKPAGSEHPLTLTDEFIAKFKPGVGASEIEALNISKDVEVVREDPNFPNQYLLRVKTVTGLEALRAANSYCEDGIVEWSHPNFIPHRDLRLVPNDTLFSEQWHLRNTGQGGGTVGADVDAVDAWDVTTGSSDIIIAVYDSGVDINHEDLSANIAPGGKNYGQGDPNDPRPQGGDPNDAHGTACAGVAAAVGNNATGVAGIAYGCRILALRFDDTVTYQDDADAFTYAAANSDVMTNSWGYSTPPNVVVTALEAAASSGRNGRGLPIFFASGNDDASIDSIDDISALPSVIAVGATTNYDNRADYSNYGQSLDIVAPSNGGSLAITTTDRTAPNGYNQWGNYCRASDMTGFGGTSSACPLATGVAALVLSNNPDLTQWQVKTILQQTADDLGSSGFDIYYGYGRVNARAAVNAPAPTEPLPTPTPTPILQIVPSDLTAGQGFQFVVYLREDINDRFDAYILADTPVGPYTIYPNGRVEKGIKAVYTNVPGFPAPLILTVAPSVAIPASMAGAEITFYVVVVNAGTMPPVSSLSQLTPDTLFVILMDKVTKLVAP